MSDDTWRVTVACDAGVWTAVVEGVADAVTQARRISELDPQVRERLAELLDQPASSFVFEYQLAEEGCAERPSGERGPHPPRDFPAARVASSARAVIGCANRTAAARTA